MKIYPLDNAIHHLNNWALNDTAFSAAALPTQGEGAYSHKFQVHERTPGS